jgi:co-chaperonin GroES (HSP10)
MAIKPILHRILVLPDKLEERDEMFKRAKAAGIEIAKEESEREQAAIDTGKVVAMGPTAFQDFNAVNPLTVDDTVVYARYGGKAIVDPDTKVKYVALNDEDVIAIITTEKGA